MQVKFRGKIINEPNGILDGQWQHGSLVQEPNGICRIRKYNKNASGSHEYSEYQVEPESLGMFTGRHDRKGNEIYGGLENDGGDICDFWAKDVARGEGLAFLGRSHVFYSEKSCAFYFIDYDIIEVPVMIADQILLIGTEIDNPEFLGQ